MASLIQRVTVLARRLVRPVFLNNLETVQTDLLLGSPWRDQISNAILKLQEDGLLQYLYTKWWKQKGAVICENNDEKKKDSANELGLANVGGVFVVLVAGLCLSFIAALLEFIWKARQVADKRVILIFFFRAA